MALSDIGFRPLDAVARVALQMAKLGLCATIPVLSCVTAVAASPLEDGVASYDRSDYATALRLLRPLADEGVAGAQYFLGAMYLGGLGVPQDDAASRAYGVQPGSQEYFQCRMLKDQQGQAEHCRVGGGVPE
jgi:hypothetical protein